MKALCDMDARGQEPKAGGRRKRRLRLLSTVLVAMLLPIAPTSALVETTIAIDGVFADWTPVFDDPANCRYDLAGDSSNTDADLTLVAATGDTDYLYTYVRRGTATGGAAPNYLVFIDLDGDGRMEATDRVLEYSLTGSNTFSSATLYTYVPADTTLGDDIDGTALRTDMKKYGASPVSLPVNGTARGEDGGSQFEGRVLWNTLGVQPNTPVKLRFYASQGSADDYADTIHLIDHDVSVEPDRTSGAAAGADVVYEHTVRNTGNVTSRYQLTATSSRGWTVSLREADGTTPIEYVDLAPGASVLVKAILSIPVTAADGTRDTLSVTARHVDATNAITGLASDATTDITTVGPLLVVPDQSGSITSGDTIEFVNTVMNNSASPYTVRLSATSKAGWAAQVLDASGTTPITEIAIGPGESAAVVVRITTPTGTALGTVDVTTVEATVAGTPNIRGRGYDTVTIRPTLTVAPDRSYPAGPGTSVLYRHTITNSSAETRTFALSATSSMGWPVAILGSDATTAITSVELPRYGGSMEVVLRVTVPAGAAQDSIDVTTLTGSYGPVSATATDSTTVAVLATYGVSGFGTPQDTFELGDVVYARGMGLPAKEEVRFQWLDPVGNLIAESNLIKADTSGVAQASYTIGTAAPVGQWSVRLVPSTGTPITVPFYVGYKADITALAATGGDMISTPVAVTSTLRNSGGAPLSDTHVTYRIWWDADSNGLLSTGDSYVASDGSWTAAGTGTGVTKETTSVAVAAEGGTYSDAWNISNEDFQESGMYKLTAEWKSSAGVLIDSQTTEFFAVPGRAGLSLTISKTEVDFGTVDPGQTYTDSGIGLTVTSGTGYTLRTEVAGQAAELGLATSLASETTGTVTSGATYTDMPSITVPWSTVPGTYAATITYTVVADIL
ncbi:MAG: hypothetical protein WBJ62_03510 [Coriobacteriia bacterium]